MCAWGDVGAVVTESSTIERSWPWGGSGLCTAILGGWQACALPWVAQVGAQREAGGVEVLHQPWEIGAAANGCGCWVMGGGCECTGRK